MALIASLRGMRDLPPAATPLWRKTERVFAECCALYGYGEIRTPVLERAELFARQLGEHTDLVEKEMYAFTDARSGELVALRPEATVSVARALVENGLHRAAPARVFYCGPMFRRERPQQGRYRQFHQMGVEALGADSAAVDAEQILLSARVWRQLGIAEQLRLDLNNLGDGVERARHREKLSAYFRRYQNDLAPEARRRVDTNPLRILDSKEDKTAAIAATAPRLSDELGAASRRHLDEVKNRLTAAGVDFTDNPALVRGLDYYNLTVYEWSRQGDNRRQNALCGGGRYDALCEQIGGPSLPGCGFALGQDRLVDLLATAADEEEAADCYLIAAPSMTEAAAKLAEQLRDRGVSVRRHVGGGNLSRQLKKARAGRAATAVILDCKRETQGTATVKQMDVGRADVKAKVAKAMMEIGNDAGGETPMFVDGDHGNEANDSALEEREG